MANRKNPSRRSRNAKKPAVIDATALEVESAGTETPADMDESAAADENPSTPAKRHPQPAPPKWTAHPQVMRWWRRGRHRLDGHR
jgi:hypothetical protein